jgi:hypothetical protein
LQPWEEVRSDLIRLKPPTIALSAKFGDPEATSKYISLTESLDAHIPMLHWESFLSAKAEPRQMDVLIEQFSSYVQTLFRTEPLYGVGRAEPLSIVHLTDLHFGDGSNRKRYLSEIGICLENQKLVADFVAITGDIIDRGASQHYAKSGEWIKSIFKSGWMRTSVPLTFPSSRILLTPGNHDFSEQIGISGYLERSPEGKFGFMNKTMNGISNATWQYGIAPFLAFHEDLTGWRVKHGEYPGFRLVSTFAAQGLHFLEIWTEAYTAGDYPPFIDKEWLDNTLSNVSTAVRARCAIDDCIVILCHRFSDNSHFQPSATFEALSQHFGALGSQYKIIVLSGHAHKSSAAPVVTNRKVLSIQGTTLSEEKKNSNELAGFNIITLSRSAGFVDGCNIRTVSRTGTCWKVNPEYIACEFEPNGHWVVREKSANTTTNA